MAITVNNTGKSRSSVEGYMARRAASACSWNGSRFVFDTYYGNNETIINIIENAQNVPINNREVLTYAIQTALTGMNIYDLCALYKSLSIYSGGNFGVWFRIEMALEGSLDLIDDETGEVIENDDYVVVNNEVFSQATIDEYFIECDHCGKYVREADAVTVHTGHGDELWCESCDIDDAYHCEYCGEAFDPSTADYEYVRDYGEVCGECLRYSDEFAYCENCGSWVREDDYDFDNDMCNRCSGYEERQTYGIRGYHSRPSIRWYGVKSHLAKVFMGTGFELEIDSGTSPSDAARYIYENWGEQVYFNHDGSLSSSGFEIISQPMTDDYMRKTFLPQIDKVFKGLVSDYDYKSHDTETCGLHFHFSKELFGYGDKRDRALEKFVNFFEDYYDDIVKFSRRKSSHLNWCKKYKGEPYSDINTDKDVKDLCKGKKYADRYHAVNLTNRNTVEVRIMRGTLNPDTFRASYDFLYTLVKNSKKVKFSDRYNLAEWFKGLKPETIEYMKSRHAFEAFTATV